MPSWTAFRTCRTCRKEARQVPVRQVLASYFANFQHLTVYSSTAAWAAANLAIGTRNGEHEA